MGVTAKLKVLVTGASGLIGQRVIKDLGDRYSFSGLSRRPVEGIPHAQADITDRDAVRNACRGMDAVLHLAAETIDYDDWERVMDVTIGGTLNLYRAAQEAGVKRVVFASAGSTMIGYEWYPGSPYAALAANKIQQLPEGERMLRHTDPPRPADFYSVGKLFGENTGRLFSDKYGMSVIVIRVGAVLPDDRPSLVRELPGYLAQSDLVSMIDKCLAAPQSVRFDVFHALSNNSRRWRDIEHARDVLGWEPRDSSDRFDPATLA
jgi:nucleoside-diphosphate-sugar epimerase